MTVQAGGERVIGAPIAIQYDALTDVLTIDGFKIAGDLLRTLTATPCGQMFRIIERKDGVVTITVERDPLAVAALDMLAALKLLRDPMNAKELTAALDQAQIAIDKAEGRRSPDDMSQNKWHGGADFGVSRPFGT